MITTRARLYPRYSLLVVGYTIGAVLTPDAWDIGAMWTGWLLIGVIAYGIEWHARRKTAA